MLVWCRRYRLPRLTRAALHRGGWAARVPCGVQPPRDMLILRPASGHNGIIRLARQPGTCPWSPVDMPAFTGGPARFLSRSFGTCSFFDPGSGHSGIMSGPGAAGTCPVVTGGHVQPSPWNAGAPGTCSFTGARWQLDGGPRVLHIARDLTPGAAADSTMGEWSTSSKCSPSYDGVARAKHSRRRGSPISSSSQRCPRAPFPAWPVASMQCPVPTRSWSPSAPFRQSRPASLLPISAGSGFSKRPPSRTLP